MDFGQASYQILDERSTSFTTDNFTILEKMIFKEIPDGDVSCAIFPPDVQMTPNVKICIKWYYLLHSTVTN